MGKIKTIKDLTRDQAIEIAKLLYPFDDIKSEIETHYQPYDASWFDDAREYYFIKFNGFSFGDKIDTYRIWIYPDLDVLVDLFRDNPLNFTEKDKKEIISNKFVLLGHLPVRNQYKIQEKFRKWKIKPIL